MNMDETRELGLKLPPPAVTPEQVAEVVRVLSIGMPDKFEWNGWMTADEIAARIEKSTDRKVRKIASASAPSIVSFPGSPGYKLWANCTVDEINHAIAAFESQATDMIKRANLFRRAYHKRFRGGS